MKNKKTSQEQALTLVVLYLLIPGTPLPFCSVHSKVTTTLVCFPFFAMQVTCLVGAPLLTAKPLRVRLCPANVIFALYLALLFRFHSLPSSNVLSRPERRFFLSSFCLLIFFFFFPAANCFFNFLSTKNL